MTEVLPKITENQARLRPTAVTEVHEPLHVAFLQTERRDAIAQIGAGTYEDWVLNFTQLQSNEIVPFYLADGDSLPNNLNGFDGIVVGGSGYNTNDSVEKAPWIPPTREFLKTAATSGIPEHIVCFGHQLQAEALDGTVDTRPGGYNFGVDTVMKTTEGKRHPVMQDLPDTFKVFNSHGRIVTELPPSTPELPVTVLATNTSGHEAIAYGDTVTTTQFHGELTRQSMKALAVRRRPLLVKQRTLSPSDEAFAELLDTIETAGQQAEKHGRQMGQNWINNVVIPHRVARMRG